MNQTLSDDKTKDLLNIIRDSFRVRRNHEPLYVDVGDHLERFGASQHQIIFGRRGSGKSCLMIHYLRKAREKGVLPIYVLADEFKRLTYPDILIRLLLSIMEEVLHARPWHHRVFQRRTLLRKSHKRLRDLLNMADITDVTEAETARTSANLGVNVKASAASVQGKISADSEHLTTSRFRARKLDSLERYLADYKKGLVETFNQMNVSRAFVLLDDFYLIPRQWQADVIDYLHRLLRDTDIYLKIATIRHRTTLLKNHPQTIGVELSQDVEEINLDRTLEDLEATQQDLEKMLRNIAQKAGVPDVFQTHMNREVPQQLALCSGGVPRDYLNIFVSAVEAATAAGKAILTPKLVWKGAGRLLYQHKLRNLREDMKDESAGLERLLKDLFTFCIRDKRKTAFLISQEEAQRMPDAHELIQQLMDMKVIHVIEPDTSAASGRPGRYEAYTLDFALFMEPRRRNIEITKFWETDTNRRKVGIREAPTYPLDRAAQAYESGAPLDEEELKNAEVETESDRSGGQGRLF